MPRTSPTEFTVVAALTILYKDALRTHTMDLANMYLASIARLK